MKKSMLILLLSSIGLLNHSSDLTLSAKNAELKYLMSEKLTWQKNYKNARTRIFGIVTIAISASGVISKMWPSSHIPIYICPCYNPKDKMSYACAGAGAPPDKTTIFTAIAAITTILMSNMLNAYNDLQEASKKITEIEQQIKMLGSVN